MGAYAYTGRVRSCGLCGRAPKLKSLQDGQNWFAWIECMCGVTTTKRKADNMRHANSAALHHWNTRDGEQKASNSTHLLRQASYAFINAWRGGEFELPREAEAIAKELEKALGRVARSLTGEAAA